MTGNRVFLRTFDSLRSAGSGIGASLTRLNQSEGEVVDPLTALDTIYTNEVARRVAAKTSADGQARIAAILSAFIAIAGVLAFAVFTLRLVLRISERERELGHTVASLSDRDTLLERLRTTTGVLGQVATELRASSNESAAAASEQSAAVAETSATIEELAVTARSISETRVSSPTPPSRRARRCATCRNRSTRSRNARSRSASARRRSARSSS